MYQLIFNYAILRLENNLYTKTVILKKQFNKVAILLKLEWFNDSTATC